MITLSRARYAARCRAVVFLGALLVTTRAGSLWSTERTCRAASTLEFHSRKSSTGLLVSIGDFDDESRLVLRA